MRKKSFSRILKAAVLLLFIILALKLSWPTMLRLYVRAGAGDCIRTPLFCMEPRQEITDFALDPEFTSQLRFYRFPKMEIFLPQGFKVTQERIKKDFYKKRGGANNKAQIYLLHEEKDFFINLYPRLRRLGVKDNYEFVKRLMYASENRINNLTDVFFLVMKGIFTPDIGDQSAAVMATFSIDRFKGFINYNLAKEGNYFDCNIINSDGGYFKAYIKDVNALLDLNKVLNIISTIRETGRIPES